MPDNSGTCFVVMGFGKKTDFESGRTLDLDKSYRNLVKPAVEAAGFECVRADEIVHSGLIDVPMYQQLLAADIVIADLSTSNKNAFYELGIRHALRPYTTIVIAEDGLKAPFDVNHIVIRSYKHLGEDIGYDEVMRFRALLTDAIATIVKQPADDRLDSPVYRYVKGLVPPALAQVATAALLAPGPQAAAAEANVQAPGETHSALMKQVDAAMERSDFAAARTLLKAVHTLLAAELPDRPMDPFIVQRLALVTYKSRHPTELDALKDACALLATLQPQTSNDTETLGLWGAVHKRLWALTDDVAHLDEAVRALERGFYLRNDYYNGINLAFLLNVRAARATDAADAIADFVLARRVRTEVRAICKQWLERNPKPAASGADPALKQDAANRYWVLATIAEADVGLGLASADASIDAAMAAAPLPWMADSTRDQVARLRTLLADSPLKHLKAAA